jgi:drug/metabolite transporter (DMT)-like permease
MDKEKPYLIYLLEFKVSIIIRKEYSVLKSNKPPIPLALILLIGIVAISFSAIFIRWSAAPVSIIAMYRLLIISACMLPFLFFYRLEVARISVRSWLQLLVSGIALGLHFLFWMGSLRYTTVASSTAILTLEPIFVMLGSLWIFQHKISRAALLSMVIAIIGASLIGWGDFQFSGTALQGDLLSLIGTVVIVIHMLIGKSLRVQMSAFVYSFFVFLFAGLVLALYNFVQAYSFTAYPARDWGVFLLLALIPTLLGHYLFNWLLKYMNATSVSMSILGEPIGASILAYFILGENISLIQVFAGGILLIGVMLFILSNRSKESK